MPKLRAEKSTRTLWHFTQANGTVAGRHSIVKISGNNLHWTVIITMIAVRVVQTPVHDITNVVAMRNRLMPAIRTVNMPVIMTNVLIGITTFGIGRTHSKDVVLDSAILFLVMQMTVMQVINVTVVFDSSVSATFSVLVIVFVF